MYPLIVANVPDLFEFGFIHLLPDLPILGVGSHKSEALSVGGKVINLPALIFLAHLLIVPRPIPRVSLNGTDGIFALPSLGEMQGLVGDSERAMTMTATPTRTRNGENSGAR